MHIFDRYHIVANLNKAVDEARRSEAKHMKEEGYENVLANRNYCVLKNPEDLMEVQSVKLNDIIQYDLKSVRVYQLGRLQLFWEYHSLYWAQKHLKLWCGRALRSRLPPIKKFVKSVRRHEDLVMNWFRKKRVFIWRGRRFKQENKSGYQKSIWLQGFRSVGNRAFSHHGGVT